MLLRRPDGPGLAVEIGGQGPPIVLLHGLTATRRYVVMGSTLLQRLGFQVIAYDARGHGESEPDRERRYTYAELVEDLSWLVFELGLERPLLAGASMGAHAALAFALAYPQLASGVVVITPGFDPDQGDEQFARAAARWQALARALRGGGIAAFLEAYGLERIAAPWRELVRKAIEQRLASHRDLGAVADAVEGVGSSRPYRTAQELAGIAVPAVVIGSQDGPDPDHPLELARRYANWLGCELVVEPPPPPPRSPLAWQGGKVARLIADHARRCGLPVAEEAI